MRGQLGRHVLLKLLERVVGIGRRQGVERHLHARQRLSAAFERDERVVERGWRGIVGDRGHFGVLLTHALVKRWSEVFVLDVGKRRRLKGKPARSQEWIRDGRLCGLRRPVGRRPADQPTRTQTVP